MPSPFVVTFVEGASPGKWARVWRERMGRAELSLVPLGPDAALAAVRDGTAHMGFLRDVSASDDLNVIPLYREQPVVVAARGSLVAALDSVTLADLADLTVLEDQDAAAIELVATGAAVVVMPASIARAHSRKDVVARPVVDAADSGIGLAWLASASHPSIDAFIGIVRGRTENSSR